MRGRRPACDTPPMSSSRPIPYVGMPVRLVHFAHDEEATVEAVLDEGRTLVAGGTRFTLRRMTGHYVREHEPYYGTRLVLRREAGARRGRARAGWHSARA